MVFVLQGYLINGDSNGDGDGDADLMYIQVYQVCMTDLPLLRQGGTLESLTLQAQLQGPQKHPDGILRYFEQSRNLEAL